MQVRMALCTTDIGSDGKPQVAAMLHMARCADRGESLIGVVKRSAVARITRLIGGLGAKRIRLLDVARGAFCRQHCMGRGHFSGAINAIVVSKCIPAQPQQRNQGKGDGKNGAQTPEGMRMLEIIQVDALRQRFSCELRSGHDNSLSTAASVTQGHDRVRASQQQKRQRKRNVQHQPSVQPVVIADLPPELPFLFA